jgi:flagellar biosynthetic protein FlhB
MAYEDQSEKTEEPTAKKVQDAREKGQVPRSREFNTWLILVAATLVILALGPSVARSIAATLSGFIAHPHDIPTDFENLRLALSEAFTEVALALGVVAVVLVAAAAGAGILQHGLVWSAESLKPELEKISLIKGFRRQFSLKALVEFAKGLAKLAIVSAVGLAVLWPHLHTLPLLVGADLSDVLEKMYLLALELLGGVIGAATVIAGLDLLYQRYEFTRGQRMSRREVRDEHKQTEGDPMVRARLRAIRMEKARQRMIAAVPEADVVVTNPTHVAVALKYDEVEMEAPTLVAKGADLVAERIREVAQAHDVPIVENPPLARALFQVDLDRAIPAETYKAVAEIISYVWRLKGHKRRDRPEATDETKARAGRPRRTRPRP